MKNPFRPIVARSRAAIVAFLDRWSPPRLRRRLHELDLELAEARGVVTVATSRIDKLDRTCDRLSANLNRTLERAKKLEALGGKSRAELVARLHEAESTRDQALVKLEGAEAAILFYTTPDDDEGEG